MIDAAAKVNSGTAVAAQTGFSLVALANMRGRQRDFDRVAPGQSVGFLGTA